MAVIRGSIYDDTIQGTASADVVDANAGDDTIDGLGGNDSLIGGAGSDLLIGGEGNDTVRAYTDTSGNWEEYLVVAVPGGFVLADEAGSGASDEVRGVEFFSFADGVFSASALPNLVDVPVITITADRASQAEGTGGATALTFTVGLDRPAEASLSVLVQGTSIHSYDYDPDRTVFPGDLVGGSYYPSERLVFAPGEVSKTFTVQLIGDEAVENDEKLTVYLREPLGSLAVLGRQSVATMTVLDDDYGNAAKVGISAVDARKAEGDGGSTAFTFTVSLDKPVDTAQSVLFAVAGDGGYQASASDFVDGVFPSGALAFSPGEVSKTLTFHVVGNPVDELDRSFRVSLSSPSAKLVLGDDSVAVATILDDDMSVARGTAGDNVFGLIDGQWIYEGFGGHDALDVRGAGFRPAEVAVEADGDVVLTLGADKAALRRVEEARFADGRLVFDADDAAARVTRLYEAALDRLPDQSGLNFWIDAVQAGQPLSGLAASFIASPEFQGRFGGASTGNGAFVDQLYLNVLGRAGEAGGRQFWLDSLGNGASRADVLVGFSESAENKAGTAALVRAGIWDRSEEAAEVARLYDTVFGRAPDLAGLTFWKEAIEGGSASLAQMADAFTGSAEFQAKHGELDNWEFAEALYRNSLDRPPGYSETIYWEDVLDAGAARSAVVLAFSESAEHVRLTAPSIGGEAPGEWGIVFA